MLEASALSKPAFNLAEISGVKLYCKEPFNKYLSVLVKFCVLSKAFCGFTFKPPALKLELAGHVGFAA